MIKKLALTVLMAGSSLAFAQPYRRDYRSNERPVVVEHREQRDRSDGYRNRFDGYSDRSDGYYDRLGCWHANVSFRR